MKKVSYCLLVPVLLFSACSGSKKVIDANKATVQQTVNTTPDGLSMANAVVIAATNDFAGVREEYTWIGKHYPGAKTKNQSLVHKDKKSYDVLTIVTADNQEKAVYFDISNSFGKF